LTSVRTCVRGFGGTGANQRGLARGLASLAVAKAARLPLS